MPQRIVEEAQRGRWSHAAATRRARGGCGRRPRRTSSPMRRGIDSSALLVCGSQDPRARPTRILGRAPSPSVNTAAVENPGFRRSIRSPYRKSCQNTHITPSPLGQAAGRPAGDAARPGTAPSPHGPRFPIPAASTSPPPAASSDLLPPFRFEIAGYRVAQPPRHRTTQQTECGARRPCPATHTSPPSGSNPLHIWTRRSRRWTSLRGHGLGGELNRWAALRQRALGLQGFLTTRSIGASDARRRVASRVFRSKRSPGARK